MQMAAPQGQVVWTAEQPSTLAQRHGLSDISYTEAGEPDDLDTEGGEAVVSHFDDVCILLGSSQQKDQGRLCITNRRLCWQGGAEPNTGYAAEFTDVGLHAIANDSPGDGGPCIYLQLAGESEPGSESDEEPLQSRELRLVPIDANSEDETDGDMYYSQDEVLTGAGADARAAMLDHFDSLLQVPRDADVDQLIAEDPDRFEDPDALDQQDPDGFDHGHQDGPDNHL